MPDQYDVIIIGGGIHGVGVAQAAAARGHSVLLLEQTALAHGTSGRSSKLIHGGLRYLESRQFSLVRECLRERQLLLRLASSLVQLRPFHIPVYRTTRRRPWQIRLGLGLYSLLGGFRREMRFRSVARSQWGDLDGLRTDNLQAVYQYYEAQTDDALLTRAVMQSALSLGADLAMPARFIAAKVQGDQCRVEFEREDGHHTAHAHVLVNAAGPWVNDVAQHITPTPPMRSIELVQGAHIVLHRSLQSGAYYMESPTDGRAVFAMPWKGNTLVGTTETKFTGDPSNVAPLPDEQSYLIHVMEHYFPDFGAARNDAILDSFAGLRVLPVDRGSAFSRSRETILVPDHTRRPRVVSIYGGKLTAYRATAEKVMRLLAPSLPQRTPMTRTEDLPLMAPESAVARHCSP